MSKEFKGADEIESFLQDSIKLFSSIIRINQIEQAQLDLIEAEKQVLLHELREPVQELLDEIDRQMALLQ